MSPEQARGIPDDIDLRRLLQGRIAAPGQGIFRVIRSDGSVEEFERVHEGRNAGADWTEDPDRFLSYFPFSEKGWEFVLWSVAAKKGLGTAYYPGEWIEGAWNVSLDSLIGFRFPDVDNPNVPVELSSEKLIEGSERQLLGKFPDAPARARLSHDGTWIGTLDTDGNVEVLDVREDGLSQPRSIGRHPGATQVGIARQSRLLATRDEAGGVRIWDTGSDTPPVVTSGPPGQADLEFSADGRLLMAVIEREVWILSLADDPPRWRNTGTYGLTNSPVLDTNGMQVAYPANGTIQWMRLRSPDGTRPIELQNGVPRAISGPPGTLCSSHIVELPDAESDHRTSDCRRIVACSSYPRPLLLAIRGRPGSLRYHAAHGQGRSSAGRTPSRRTSGAP